MSKDFILQMWKFGWAIPTPKFLRIVIKVTSIDTYFIGYIFLHILQGTNFNLIQMKH